MPERETDNDQEANDQPRAGGRLAAARRDQDISLRDIAKELHLDEAKVQALEQNRFETLGAPVFAKGHLKKYADIVGVSAEDILHDYYQLNRSVGAPPVVRQPGNVAREIDLTRYVVPAIVALAFAAVILWWLLAGSPLPSFGDTASEPASAITIEPPARETTAPVAPEPNARAETDEAPTVEDDEPEEAQPEQEPTVDIETSAPSVTRSEPDTAIAGPEVRVTLTFSGDCWTEVTDASGSRLFFDLGRDGRSVNFSGAAPLRVLFGNYANVSLTVDGEPFDIPRAARRGETARFSIDAP